MKFDSNYLKLSDGVKVYHLQQIYTENPVVRLGYSLHNRNLEVRLGHSLFTIKKHVIRLGHSLYTRCLLSYLILDKGNIFKVKLKISPMMLHLFLVEFKLLHC